ncbi:hypothetical protein BDU57DRAFT_360578 [Ampelomyces quisqualis]|uniref:Uncharacterized protein n=1 Tax=Ampelomyces quisqualis TaxID=50730 RepID=A0A6A5QAD9_AMPQU|nr:hypothetical protein BDU57DRAFT_360578 [Ampelomyces quisqualis]
MRLLCRDWQSIPGRWDCHFNLNSNFLTRSWAVLLLKPLHAESAERIEDKSATPCTTAPMASDVRLLPPRAHLGALSISSV